MCSEVAITVENICKRYVTYGRPHHRLLQMLWKRRRERYPEFHALADVSFQVRRGETLGIMGRNGCGKSTLLQIICGTLLQSSGTFEVNGRISALLELGAGFDGQFTGRENIYMNGAILGLVREEIDARFAEISSFADIGDFIDQPVRTYSTGMNLRLGFAIAVGVDPDIFVVDEALSVGDEAFQRKCFARIEKIQENGGTILLVSHSGSTINTLCSRALLLDGGELLMEGLPASVVNQYLRLVALPYEAAGPLREEIRQVDGYAAIEADKQSDDNGMQTVEPDGRQDLSWFDPNLISESVTEYESRGAIISNVRIVTEEGRRVNVLEMGRRYIYEYDVEFSTAAEQVGFGMLIKTVEGIDLAGTSTGLWDTYVERVPAGQSVTARFVFSCNLRPGAYFTNAGSAAIINGERQLVHRLLDAMMFRVESADEVRISGLVDLDIQPEIMTGNSTLRMN